MFFSSVMKAASLLLLTVGVTAAPAEVVQSGGTFIITNAKAGTVVDLSGFDNTSIIGYPYHGGSNQQWKINWAGDGWTLQAASSNQYLGFNNSASAGDGTNITALAQSTSTPTKWHIWHDDVNSTNYRIFVPNTTLNLDLFGQGEFSQNTGIPITLWYRWAGVHQTWSITAV